MSLLDLANRHLFGPMGQPVQYWPRDPQGYCIGPGDVNLSPLQLALFGQMILKHGYWRGMKILDPDWVAESLDDSSETTWENYWPYRNIRYGNLWWYAEVNGHEVHFAWGHGGQFVTVVPTLDLVVVTYGRSIFKTMTEPATRRAPRRVKPTRSSRGPASKGRG